ncbi:hypothetical protein V8E36_003414 [Tilletia maclaganii]
MLDLNIPWPAQSFADAHRAGVALRQHQQQHQQQQQRAQASTSAAAAAAAALGGDSSAVSAQGGDQPPLSKKARKKLQKQQQQQQSSAPAAPTSASTESPTASAAAPAAPSKPPTLPEWNALDDLPAHDQLRLRLLTLSLASLGYKSCAFNHTFSQPTRFDPTRHGNPFSAFSVAATAASSSGSGKGKAALSGPGGSSRRHIAQVPFPELDPRIRSSALKRGSSGKGKEKASVSQTFSDKLAIDPALLDPGATKPQSLRITQLHRLTIPLDDSSSSSAPGQGHGLVASAGPALQSYDILAVAPTTESAFSLACLSLAELKPFGIDIISLDLGSQPRLPFWVKRSLVKAALQLGVVFEIAYSGALPVPSSTGSTSSSSGTSDVVRRNLISSTRSLLLLTKGTNVILSSGARDAMQLRAPMDVINLFGAILGMGEGAARRAISAAPEAVIRRARARKEIWRGIVGEVRIRSGPEQPASTSASSKVAGLPSDADRPESSQQVAAQKLVAALPSKDAGKKKRKRDDASSAAGG